MNVTKIIKICLILFLGTMAIYEYCFYTEIKFIVENEKSVEYRYSQTKTHKGRGVYYEMIADYRGRSYNMDITGSTFAEINEGTLPDLYYSSKFDTLFSHWKIKKTFRLFLLFAAGFLIVLSSFFWRRATLK
jgi:hypothetical protein